MTAHVIYRVRLARVEGGLKEVLVSYLLTALGWDWEATIPSTFTILPKRVAGLTRLEDHD